MDSTDKLILETIDVYKEIDRSFLKLDRYISKSKYSTKEEVTQAERNIIQDKLNLKEWHTYEKGYNS